MRCRQGGLKEITVAVLGPGDILDCAESIERCGENGELETITVANADVVALSDVKVYEMNREKMLGSVNKARYAAFVEDRQKLRRGRKSQIEDSLRRLIPQPHEKREDAEADEVLETQRSLTHP